MREQIDSKANRLHRETRQDPVKAGRKPLTTRERLARRPGGWSGLGDDPSQHDVPREEIRGRFRPCEDCGGSPDIHNTNRGRLFVGHAYR